MIWVNVASGRFHDGTDGAEKIHNLAIQSLGLQVKDLLGAIVVTGRGSGNAKVRLRFDEGATDDLNEPSMTATNNLIHNAGVGIAVPTTIPGTLKGSLSIALLPVLRFQLGVSCTATDAWVEVSVYVGGKPY